MRERIDRRTFLATATATGVALGTQLRRIRADDVSAANKIVVGVMGTGGRGTNLIANLCANQPQVEIAYVCDVNLNNAGRAADAIGKAGRQTPKSIQDFRRILEDPAVDALIGATCNHWHGPATILACAAGKHVYTEKPCSHNPHEGELMIAAARKHNRQVQMGTQRRSCPHIIEAIEQLHKGVIGPVYLAQSWYSNNRATIGHGKAADVPKELDYDLWQGPAPHQPYRENILPYNWHWFWTWGNGELGNNGVHFLDLCRWGLGVDYPIHVSSSGGHYRFQDDQETPDTHLVGFDFEGNKSATWEGLSCSRFQDGRGSLGGTLAHFHGDNGSLVLTDRGYTVYDPKGKEVPNIGGQTEKADYAGFVKDHMTNFFEAIRGNAKLNAEIEQGHKSTMLCHLGNIAYRTGRSLRCQPQDGRILGDDDAMQLWKREYEKGWEPKV